MFLPYRRLGVTWSGIQKGRTAPASFLREAAIFERYRTVLGTAGKTGCAPWRCNGEVEDQQINRTEHSRVLEEMARITARVEADLLEMRKLYLIE